LFFFFVVYCFLFFFFFPPSRPVTRWRVDIVVIPASIRVDPSARYSPSKRSAYRDIGISSLSSIFCLSSFTVKLSSTRKLLVPDTMLLHDWPTLMTVPHRPEKSGLTFMKTVRTMILSSRLCLVSPTHIMTRRSGNWSVH